VMLATGLDLLQGEAWAKGVNLISTNASNDATNEVQPPGATFTNSVEMELVKVSAALWAGKFVVTQKQYQKVMAANPSAFGGDSRPVDSVSWNEAVEFCAKLTELDVKKLKLPKGFYYSLPTEEEWQTLVADATLENAVTSLNGQSRSGTSPAGSLAPNSLGLYDVRGNVAEFCLGDDSKPYRILKGGSWQDFVEVNLRPEFRWYCQPDERRNTFGFRCVLKAGAAGH
jgi:formylglycine-generating enzyme required for sulfatase activity